MMPLPGCLCGCPLCRDGRMHEATRRLLGVLLQHLDGFDHKKKTGGSAVCDERVSQEIPLLLLPLPPGLLLPLPLLCCALCVSGWQGIHAAPVACPANTTASQCSLAPPTARLALRCTPPHHLAPVCLNASLLPLQSSSAPPTARLTWTPRCAPALPPASRLACQTRRPGELRRSASRALLRPQDGGVGLASAHAANSP